MCNEGTTAVTKVAKLTSEITLEEMIQQLHNVKTEYNRDDNGWLDLEPKKVQETYVSLNSY